MDAQERYQQALELSREMLAAGRLQEWESLTSLEARRSALLHQTQDSVPTNTGKVVSLIREIQGCDAELKEILTTAQEHIRVLLRIPPPEQAAPSEQR